MVVCSLSFTKGVYEASCLKYFLLNKRNVYLVLITEQSFESEFIMGGKYLEWFLFMESKSISHFLMCSISASAELSKYQH